MIRFWFFAAFVMALAARQPGGIRAAVHTHYPVQQVLRGLLLAAEVCVMVVAFVRLGLVETRRTTFRLLDAARVAALCPGTLLLNTARGGVVEESALLSRLQTDADLDVVLDTWENEPTINLELLRHTLIGTPHIAGYSLDGKVRGTQMVYRACCDFLHLEPCWESPLVWVEPLRWNGQDSRQDILDAYAIGADDERLKALLLPPNKEWDVGNYFDRLRKTYPARREFSSLVFF